MPELSLSLSLSIYILVFVFDLDWFKDILIFLKEVSYAYQHCIYLIENTVNTVLLWNIIMI